jgi:predicted dehydrogenase
VIKIGLIGVGHLGKIHLKLLLELQEQFELVGFLEYKDEVAEEVVKEFGIRRFATYSELLEEVDAVDIVTPTVSHFQYATEALRNRKHVFVEKPMVENMEESKKLVSLVEEAEVKLQVGHVERFNPAFKAAKPYLSNPMFIETHRLAQFNPRGTDVPVVLDLMIHDLDIILSVVQSGIKKVSASGVAVVSDTYDIANARIEFDNGCVANLTASRISMKNMRKSRFFQKDAYVSVDFMEKSLEVVKMESIEQSSDPFEIVLDLGEKGKRKIEIIKPNLEETNAIKEELHSFYDSIVYDKAPAVSHLDGASAMELAFEIISKM